MTKVEELLDEMDSDVVEGYPRDVKKVAALRKAVIREDSVGGEVFENGRRVVYGFYADIKMFDGPYDLVPRNPHDQ